MRPPVLIETTYKGKSCLPSVYMEAAVRDVLPQYDHKVAYRRVEIRSRHGKQRFLELSCNLFGDAGVYQHHRIAPIPGLFIDGELAFDTIPPRDELETAIENILKRHENGRENSRYASKSQR